MNIHVGMDNYMSNRKQPTEFITSINLTTHYDDYIFFGRQFNDQYNLINGDWIEKISAYKSDKPLNISADPTPMVAEPETTEALQYVATEVEILDFLANYEIGSGDYSPFTYVKPNDD